MSAPEFVVPEIFSSITEDGTTIYPNIAAAANGSGVYSYLIYHKYTPSRYSIRRLDADLATIGSDSDVPKVFGDYAKFAGLSDGSFLFLKIGSSYGSNDITATKILPDGTVQSTSTVIPSSGLFVSYYADVIGTPDGGFVVLFSTSTVQNPSAAVSGDLRLKLVYVSSTNVVGTPVEIDSGFKSWASTGESNNKHMAILSNGDLAVSWFRYLNPSVNQTGALKCRVFNLTDLSTVSGILDVGSGTAYSQIMVGVFPATNGYSILYIDTDVGLNNAYKLQTFFNDGSVRSIPVSIGPFFTGFVYTDYSRYSYAFSDLQKAAPNGNPDGALIARGNEIRSFTSLRDGKISVHSVTVDPGNANNLIRYTEIFDPGTSESPPPNVYSIRIF